MGDTITELDTKNAIFKKTTSEYEQKWLTESIEKCLEKTSIEKKLTTS